MKLGPTLLFRGAFGRRAAELAARSQTDSCLIDLEAVDPASRAAAVARSGRAVAFLSDPSVSGLDELSESLRAAGVRWTSVHVSPTMLRVGPVIEACICYRCATMRYLSAPGSAGLSRFEQIAQGGDQRLEIAGYLETVVELAVAEAVRQVGDPTVPPGFIRKIELLTFAISDAIAVSIHGCDRCGPGRAAAGARFYVDLQRDLANLFVER